MSQKIRKQWLSIEEFQKDQGTGPQGVQGAQGGQGSVGDQGVQGDVGEQGDQGDQGYQGYQGFVGEQGVAGPQGNQGFQGDTGPQGEIGPQGNVGSQGVPGTQGNQGFQGVTGAQGDQGTQGNIGEQGETGSTGAQGNQGDQGDAGATGSQGAQGNIGAQGATGSQGSQGSQGDAGAQGTQGSQGLLGEQGYAGPEGIYGNMGSMNFDSGSTEPEENEILTGATSGAIGKVVAVTVSSGTWGGGDAEGTIAVKACEGRFNDNEDINGSVGGANILTVNHPDTGVGVDLVQNGEFEGGTTGWTAGDSTLASIAGGQVGNCLEITRVGGSEQLAHQLISLTAGKIYKLTVYVKSGTSGNEAFRIGIGRVGIGWDNYLEETSSGSWVVHTLTFVSTIETSIIVDKVTATPGTMLFDEISLYETTYGLKGVQGDQGAVGAQGAQGSQGNVGAQGAVGSQGAQGHQGDIGATGSQGAQGNVGAQGETGSTGAQGNQGDQGDTGSQGATGSQGSTGSQGATGSQGNQGFQGDLGEQGYQGNQGFVGSQGVAGAQGNQGFQGTTGNQGATGSQGTQGTQGNQGPDGAQGLTGYGMEKLEEIFDGLNTAAIHGQGSYEMAGTWDTTAGASTSAEVVVKSGADKMLRLTDNNAAGTVLTVLDYDAGHEVVMGVMKFSARVSAASKKSYIGLYKSGIHFATIWFYNDNNIHIADSSTTPTSLQAYAINTWYAIKVHFDSSSGKASVFIDNVFKGNITMDYQYAYYADQIKIQTDAASSGYTFDIDDLFVLNLTV